MTSKWSDVRDSRLATAADRERYAAARTALDEELEAHRRTLRELRRARELTQTQLARGLGVTQAQVSRIETQADLYLSTLRSYVEAMGGELELRVVFPDGAWAEVSVGSSRRTAKAHLIHGNDGTTGIAVPDERAPAVWHVLPHPKGGWCVRGDGRARSAAVAPTKVAAISRARELARRRGGEVVVHRKAAEG